MLDVNVSVTGQAALLLVATTKDSKSIRVSGGLRFKIEGNDKYIHLGFTNLQDGSYKNFITVTNAQTMANFGYDNAEDDTKKNVYVAGYNGQCTVLPPRISQHKMFQYIIKKRIML